LKGKRTMSRVKPAFYGNEQMKANLIDQIRQHYEHGSFSQEVDWQQRKGTHVGCVIQTSPSEMPGKTEAKRAERWYQKFEALTNIPWQIADVFDLIFVCLPYEEAIEFPLTQLEATPVGADLSLLVPQFILWALNDPTHGIWRLSTIEGKQVTEKVIQLYQRILDGKRVYQREWQALNVDAEVVYEDVVRRYYNHHYIYAAGTTKDAIRFPLHQSNSGLRPVEQIAKGVAWGAFAERNASKRAYTEAYRAVRDKLLELLASSPIPE
jgi:hypothetical protein